VADGVVVYGVPARVVAYILRARGEHSIEGFLDDISPARRGSAFGGATVLGGGDLYPELRRRGVTHAIVGIGDCAVRVKLAALARSHGLELATAIHPQGVVAPDVPVGGGTVVMAGAVVNTGSRLGENVIVNTGASVDHDGSIGDGVHVGPGAHLGGGVSVGAGTWIGIGATVVDHVKIGSGSIVGAGAVVLGDVADGVVVYGVPARVAKRVGE